MPIHHRDVRAFVRCALRALVVDPEQSVKVSDRAARRGVESLAPLEVQCERLERLLGRRVAAVDRRENAHVAAGHAGALGQRDERVRAGVLSPR